ncbi:DUF1489 family protein [Sandarakinorhabdus sp.]|uniref:DUF1489 family protein n=1 Tax=Sandarakinorhabdus sp. TaxID=1916663 RepID=UPI00286E98AE|nr:DUF1489 family protein [Sandarakinorhabdus sp.]
MLHLTKVAVGCPDIETLSARQQLQSGPGAAASLTRFMPKRAAELIGGSLFWIIRHRLVARQDILGLSMMETPWGVKCRIDLAPGPVSVVPRACKAHQGWRYLAPELAPPDGEEDGNAMSAEMAKALADMGIL